MPEETSTALGPTAPEIGSRATEKGTDTAPLLSCSSPRRLRRAAALGVPTVSCAVGTPREAARPAAKAASDAVTESADVPLRVKPAGRES